MRHDPNGGQGPLQADVASEKRAFLRNFALASLTGAALMKNSKAQSDVSIRTGGEGAQVLDTTLALLRDHAAIDSTSVITLGYYDIGDGGGAVFQKVTSDHEVSDFQTAKGVHWRLIPAAGLVNVRQFGASGDERHDDTIAIRAAAAFVREGGGAVLFFPSGTYAVTGPIIQFRSGDKRFAVQGQDSDTTHILVAGALNGPLINIQGGPGQDRVEWISFRELTFLNRNRKFSGDAVRIQFAYHIDWIRCRWINFDGRALDLDNYWDSNFEGCRIIGCGVPEDANDPSQGRSAVWIGCREDCDSSNNLNFVACQFEASWHHQIEIDTLSRRIHLISCKFHGRQGVTIPLAQILVRGAKSGKISSCSFAYGQDHDHILLAVSDDNTMARGWIITGCDFSYSAGAAVRIQAATDMIIAHNNFGAIAENEQSIVIEATATASRASLEIITEPNTFSGAQTRPDLPLTRSERRQTDGSGWRENHLKLGDYHLWVDAQGQLRMKAGPPDKDIDGRLVGTELD